MVTFNPEKYRAKIEESRRRLEIARRFEEPDRVPILISTAGSYYTRLFGYNIRDYYTDLELQLEIQVQGLQWAYEELGDDRTGYGLHVDLGPVAEGIYFDLPISYPDDTSPWVHHAFSGPEAIEKLEIPDPEDHPGVQRVYRLYEEQKARVEKMGLNLPVSGGLQIHPPLSAACAIFPVEEIYTYLCTEPELIHKLFRKLYLAFCKLQEFRDKYFDRKSTSIGLADDNSAFISDEMYRKFVLPYNKAIYERYGKQGRHLHADGPNDHHFKTYAEVLKLTSMDIGGFSDVANAKRDLGGKVFFSGGLNCRDLYGTFAEAKPAVDRAIRIGAPGGGYALAIGGETYPGVRPDTLIQVVTYAKEVGRYPIQL
ncbi:MAG TPA: hypothetical protein EYP85_01370 [Armatimonadetes bacterium]|nr:hypothetical protein [Armatimonadota bacterium]